MFHDIPRTILDRMRQLEDIDSRQRREGMPPPHRLRQIPPETGRFVALLAASAPKGTCIEIGTGGGYSTLWLALAGKEVGSKIVTFEVLEEKARIARETFESAGVEEQVELVVGDAREYLQSYKDISFCFLDSDKEVYGDCFEAVIPNMVSGGLLVADNAISHREALGPMLNRALSDERVDALIVLIGKGELVCRRI